MKEALLFVTNNSVNFKSNLALLYNKGHNLWKSALTWKIPQNWIFQAELVFKAFISSPICREGKQPLNPRQEQ